MNWSRIVKRKIPTSFFISEILIKNVDRLDESERKFQELEETLAVRSKAAERYRSERQVNKDLAERLQEKLKTVVTVRVFYI